MAELSLKSLLVPSKAIEVEFPGMPGFLINVAFLSRETLINIRKKATKTTFKNRQPQEELDDELFLQLYVHRASDVAGRFELPHRAQCIGQQLLVVGGIYGHTASLKVNDMEMVSIDQDSIGCATKRWV